MLLKGGVTRGGVKVYLETAGGRCLKGNQKEKGKSLGVSNRVKVYHMKTERR